MTVPAILQVTPEEMADYIARSAVPGVFIPVENHGVYTVRHPVFGNISPGEVIVFVSPDGLTIVNRAIPGRHWFAGGQVVRTARMNEDGSWTITTRGFGNNYGGGMDGFNKAIGPGIFWQTDWRMMNNIMRDHPETSTPLRDWGF